ncbi:hypothetical protein CMI47_08190 [Candidatus Pacearchaeota archaeon]|nr:hypothetical protein [Candidatus Pacearchaeota archaeon]
MSRKTLKDFLSQNGSTESSIAYVIADNDGNGSVNTGDDLGADPGTQKELLDLADDTNGLLGDYLRFIVDLVRPTTPYKVKGGNFEAASSNRGDVIVFAEDQGVDSTFTKNGTTLGSEMGKYSNSGQFDETSNPLSSIIDKTGATSDSHEMLSTIAGSAADKTGATFPSHDQDVSAVEGSINQILGRRNRFSPDHANQRSFSSVPTAVSDLESGENDAGTATVQREFGEYDSESSRIINDKLKSVGSSLLLKAAGWDRSSTPGDSQDPQEIGDDYFLDSKNDDVSSELRSVDPSVLRSMNAKGSPEIEDGSLQGYSSRHGRGSFLTQDDIDRSKKSYGSTYTDSSMFDSSGSRKIIKAQAAAAIVALMESSKLLMSMIGESVSDNLVMYPGPYVSGKGPNPALNSKFELLQRLAISPTDYPYDKCVIRGMRVLFTDDSSPTSSGELSSEKSTVVSHQHVQEAPGFWLAVARSILRSVNEIGDIGSGSSSVITSLFMTLGRNKIIGFLNVAATIGNISFKMTGGNLDFDSINDSVNPWNVDNLDDGPATRISKSRSGDGNTSLSLAWRGSSVPSAYLVPSNIINTAIDMGTMTDGTNPIKGILGTSVATKAYIDENMAGESSRIPGEVVERLENILDAEYVPFYFHDLRTNEIVAFHAFIDTLSDRYSPGYSGDSTGYGRMDTVKSYSGTKRTISFAFYAISTSKEDFDEMWWKINKLTTLVYPKWTQGDKVSVDDSTFIQPFSQKLGASPIIRLRIGDVIKGNYSKFNLARMFGIGDTGIAPKVASDGSSDIGTLGGNIAAVSDGIASISKKFIAAFYAQFGSPLGTSMGNFSLLNIGGKGGKAVTSFVSQFLINGFANPIGIELILDRMRDPDSSKYFNYSDVALGIDAVSEQASKINFGGTSLGDRGYRRFGIHYLRASHNNGYITEDDSAIRFRITRPIRIMILGRTFNPPSKSSSDSLMGSRTVSSLVPVNRDGESRTFSGPMSDINKKRTIYSVKIVDPGVGPEMIGKTLAITHADIMPNPSFLFNTTVLGFSSAGALTVQAGLEAAIKEAAIAAGVSADLVDISPTSAASFMKEDNNPIVKSFNSSRGRGLAGAITSLDFNWMEFPWEIDWNARAPMACKIVISFDVIHDLPPGLDHAGFNRAPIYNVGGAMEHVAGDPYDDTGAASRSEYTSEGKRGIVSAYNSIKNLIAEE